MLFRSVSGGDLCGGGGAFAAATSIDREEAGEEDAGHPVPSSRVGYICWRSGIYSLITTLYFALLLV